MRPFLPIAVLLLAVTGGLLPAPAAAIGIAQPAEGGVAPLGTRVPFQVADCVGDARVHIRVLTDAEAVDGPAVAGCDGVVDVPSQRDLADAGVDEAQVTGLELHVDGKPPVSLHPQRIEAEHITDLETEPAEDPLGGGLSATVPGEGVTLDIGTADLTGISSVSVRYATPADGGYACAALICSAGAVEVLADGQVISAQELAPTGGWQSWERIVLPLGSTGSLAPVPTPDLVPVPDGPVQLAVRFSPVVAGCGGAGVGAIPQVAGCGADDRLLRLNHVELNGHGFALPYQAPPDPPGTVVLFDGDPADPFAGWTLSGGNCLPGTPTCLPSQGAHDLPGMEYVEEERAMRTDGAFGLLWHEQEFSDYTLRLQFRVERITDNGGVYVRFPAIIEGADGWDANAQGQEFQIDDLGTAYPQTDTESQTGSAYALDPSDRIATNAVGEWNTYEVDVRGQQYTVTINGRTVTRFSPPAEDDIRGRHDAGHIGLQIHDPSAHVWYRDVRVIPHRTDMP